MDNRKINRSREVDMREFRRLGREPNGTVLLNLREEKIKRGHDIFHSI